MAKKHKLKRKLPLIIFSMLMVAVFFVGYAVATEFFFPKHPGELAKGKEDKDILDKGRLNFLLLGMDARPDETVARTDSVIFVSVDKETNQMSMMSIPRDTRVEIPGHGHDKINAATVYGGPELASKAVSNLLGVPIDYYVLTNFAGFEGIVDAIGGVDYYVDQNMRYYDPMDGTRINLDKGQQILDGDKALQLVRYRSYPNGDIERSEQQQRFLKVLAQQMLQPSTVTKIHKLVPAINNAVDTNLGLTQMVSLAKAARNLGNAEIVTQTLPGRFAEINGLSYWYVEPADANRAVLALFKGETTDAIQGATIVQNPRPVQQEPVAQKPKKEEPKRGDGTNGNGDNSVTEPGNNDHDIDVETPPAQPESNGSNPVPWLPSDDGEGEKKKKQDPNGTET